MKAWRAALLACALTVGLSGLSGCGFRPIYGEAAKADERLNQVDIALIRDRSGQQLRNYLIDRMYLNGRPDRPEYDLSISLAEVQVDLGIQKDATATRSQITIAATYVLTSRAERKLLTTGSVRQLSSYNVLPSEYATLVAEQDARERTLRAIGDDIVLRLSLFLNSRP
jgi:LPS-assembly lipoprotein